MLPCRPRYAPVLDDANPDVIRRTMAGTRIPRRVRVSRPKRAGMVLPLYPSPVQMLSMAGPGSQERATDHAPVAHAGGAELGNLANYAVVTNNTILASALLARLDHLPKPMPRPFSATELSEAMVGERHRTVTKMAKTVAATFQRLINQNRAFERGKVNLVANIRDALSQRDLAA